MRPDAKVSVDAALSPSLLARITLILPSGRLCETKMSPFGATRNTRAPVTPVAKGSTLNPGMDLSAASAGFGTTLERLAEDGVSSGAATSSGRILRIMPGLSICQSPKADRPPR